MNKPVVKELIQQQLTVENLRKELRQLLYDEHYRKQIKQDYALLKQKLSEQGDASLNAAKSIVAFLKT
jgi:lipid-A-disaccharide synthase